MLLSLALLFSVDYMHHLSFLHMLSNVSSHLLAVRECESSTHTRKWVYFSKIEHTSYYQELVSHPMPEYVDELNCLVE